MSADKQKDKLARRDFLRNAGVGAAAAVAATAIVPAGVEAAPENAETRKKQRYKETDHVKRYYETNRL
ncbi:MAG TPA: ubiquinol-cytochrome c reductase iron-sulfur subunit N-terminal domain-containing protein [Ferrovibrio sp.]|uniref:ubiquinol-cytochrome c reductase iron-sulfur subunit N-terminal domain-containing protein n=1 Tax=Ferrovibrio sp. TaxID=1917215 RepID=UPI002B4B549A|nr:ubiquinol-cytochrome c reductase iron-sulfur subunit N-terminal domain-containing protein [Ferrovibrio sp.]HLT77296.1 ubiquinol-cytochrome c reductase iron-sulfur subunit N-terminal domain-containing protein [Ferrovibrio sp.]